MAYGNLTDEQINYVKIQTSSDNLNHVFIRTNNNNTKNRFTDEDIEHVNSINLLDYVSSQGYEIERVGRDEIKVKDHGGLFIQSNNNQWNGFTLEAGGGIVQFIMAVEHRTWKQAVQQLMDYNPRIHVDVNTLPITNASVLEHDSNSDNGAHPILPERTPDKYSRVYAYLTSKRKINHEVVSFFVKEKKLYESADYHNCVFVGYDKDGDVRYASYRSTNDKQVRGEVRNSNKSFSFSREGTTDRLYVFESPIDMMSYMTFMKMNGVDFKKDNFLSLAGVTENALDHYMKEHNVKTIVTCLDNDEAGYQGNERIRQHYRGQCKVIAHIPNYKDWNEDLVQYTNELCEDHQKQQINEQNEIER
jgi:hypothetical protein